MDAHVLNQKKKFWFLKLPTSRKQKRKIAISSSIPQIKIAQGQFNAKQKSFCAIVLSSYILIWKTVVSTWASELNEQVGWVKRYLFLTLPPCQVCSLKAWFQEESLSQASVTTTFRSVEAPATKREHKLFNVIRLQHMWHTQF